MARFYAGQLNFPGQIEAAESSRPIRHLIRQWGRRLPARGLTDTLEIGLRMWKQGFYPRMPCKETKKPWLLLS